MRLSVVLLPLLIAMFTPLNSIALAATMNPGAPLLFNGADVREKVGMVSGLRGANVLDVSRGEMGGIPAAEIEPALAAKTGTSVDSALAAPTLTSDVINEGMDGETRTNRGTPGMKTAISQRKEEKKFTANGGVFPQKFLGLRKISPQNFIGDLHRVHKQTAFDDYPKNEGSRTLLLAMPLEGSGFRVLRAAAKRGYEFTKNAPSYGEKVGLLPSSDSGSRNVLNVLGNTAHDGYKADLGLSGTVGSDLSIGVGGNAIGANIAAGLGSVIRSGLGSFGGSVGTSIASSLASGVRDGLSSDLDSSLGGILGVNIGANVSSDVGVGWNSNFGRLGGILGGNIGANVGTGAGVGLNPSFVGGNVGVNLRG